MTDDKIKSFLILKYGTMGEALMLWLIDPTIKFSPNEEEFLKKYVKTQFPNLDLITHKKVDK